MFLPKEQARLEIGRKLKEAGWEVVDRKRYSPTLFALAVREGILKGFLEVDYLLFVEGKAVGIIEAKRSDSTLSEDVQKQTENYAHNLLGWHQYWQNPLPFICILNAKGLLFKSVRCYESTCQPLLQMHTPKEMVDAVGVTERNKYMSKPRDGGVSAPANPTLEQLLEQITHGYLSDYYLNMLASSLSRINARSKEKHREEFATIATATMYDLSVSIFNALEEGDLPAFEDINQLNTERKALVALLANNPQARECLLTLNVGFVNILIPGEDMLIFKGFSQEEALSATQAFEEYVNAHRDEIEPLHIIYNNTNEPITYALFTDLKNKGIAN